MKPKFTSEDFIAWRIMYNATPMSEEAADLIAGCLNYLSSRLGYKIRELERLAAIHRLSMWERRARHYM